MLNYFDAIKAQSGIPVDDIWAQLWGNTMSTEYVITTYTGTLPATLTGTKAGYLESYKIYGNTVQDGTPTPENPIIPSGCGERTGNLLNESTLQNGYYGTWTNDYDVFVSDLRYRSFTLNLPAGTYTLNIACDVSIKLLRVNNSIDKVVQVGTNDSPYTFTLTGDATIYVSFRNQLTTNKYPNLKVMLNSDPTPLPYEPYGYKLPILSNSTVTDIYIGDTPLAKDEYVDSTTGKIYRRTKNLSPPEEEWIDGQIWGDGTVHPSTQIKTSPFIDVSTCETCIMEVFSAETEWAEAGYREMAFYDENKQYLGWIGGGGRQTLTPNSTERWSEFPAGTVYVRISCSHGDQPFYPQLVSGYTPTHQFYPYLIPTDPPAPFPQIPTAAGSTTISWAGEGLAPSEVELTYKGLRR